MARIDYFNDPNAPRANSIVPSVTAIVTDERGDILLVHKTDNDLWALPGGGMDVGEYIAAQIFNITLERSARKRAHDGRFIAGALAGRTVNVKWYGKQEGVLDLHARGAPDYYLALTGPAGSAVSSRGGTRPWVIQSVYLFDARRLLEDLRARDIKIRTGSSVRQVLWKAAEIYPEPRNTILVLPQEQRDLLALFGPGRGTNG